MNVEVEHPDRCSVLATRGCLYPFPNDEFTVTDKSTATGRRIAFDPESMPINTKEQRVDPTEWNRNDGFSPGQPLVAYVDHVDLKRSGAAPLTDIGSSLDDKDTAIVVIDADNGKHHPLWAEIDERDRKAGEDDPATIVRPAVNWIEGHRYVVAFRHLVDRSGDPVKPNPVFAAYRDDTPTDQPAVEKRRRHMEGLFATLKKAGIARGDLTLAWDFTVASQKNLSERVLTMRNGAMKALGSGAPAFTIVPTPADDTADGDARVIEGTFDVPLYLTGKGEPGSRLTQDGQGLPKRNGTYTASFTCVLPVKSGDTGAPAKPGQAVVYGHGLLGSQDEVLGFGDYAIDHDSVLCATDWIGLAEEDTANAVAILNDLSNMPTLADRVQQSFVNFQYLARLMKSPDGLSSNPAFTGMIATGDVAYWGRSQGGIFGGGATAVSTEWTRAVLGEPGMNYSTLLGRSVDFDDYSVIQDKSYPNLVDRPLLIGLMQMLWDRGEANAYAHHLSTDPLPGTPEHTVMLFMAFGDHQVTNVATEVQARTIGAKLKEPALAKGRSPDVEPFWGIESFGSLPADGNVLYPWDFGTPPPPVANLPNRAGDDPHDMDADTPSALDVVAAFLAPNGEVIDTCGAKPCTARPAAS
ncbi:MAG: hypothetical protein ACR2MB_16630 [Acidimicrobiales bacterium]